MKQPKNPTMATTTQQQNPKPNQPKTNAPNGDTFFCYRVPEHGTGSYFRMSPFRFPQIKREREPSPVILESPCGLTDSVDM